MITSAQNERVKRARLLLREGKVRRKHEQVALEGVRLVRDALASGQTPDYILYDPEQHTPEDEAWLSVAPEIFKTIGMTEQSQGVIGVFALPEASIPEAITRALILDGVRDPGNLGTIMRVAAAAGVELVILAPGCVDPYNDKVLRAGMGAHFRLNISEQTWDAIAETCAGVPIYLADMTGDYAYDRVDWRDPHALIVGGEAHGASEQARARASARVFIPMDGDTESINAAMAAAVLLFEGARQRRADNA